MHELFFDVYNQQLDWPFVYHCNWFVVKIKLRQKTAKKQQQQLIPLSPVCEPNAETKGLLVNNGAPSFKVPWLTPDKKLTHTFYHLHAKIEFKTCRFLSFKTDAFFIQTPVIKN